MVSKKCPVVTSDQYAEKISSPNALHLSPSPSMISKRQLPVSYSWNSDRVHVARLGELFRERYKIIHTTISYNTIQYNTTLLSLCREICFLARHLHKNMQRAPVNNKTSTTQ